MQSDPIGLIAGVNTFGYVGQNPLSTFDFYGLSACEKAGFKACSSQRRQCNSRMCGFMQPTTCAIPCQQAELECQKAVTEKCKDQEDEEEKTPEERSRDRLKESLRRAREIREQSSIESDDAVCSVS